MERKSSKLTLKILEKERDDGPHQQIKEVTWAASGRRPSRPIQRPTQTLERTFISLKGLMTAQKFSKGLKERAAKRGLIKMPVTIIREQVPMGCSQPAEHFSSSRASRLLQDFLDTHLESVTYDISSAGPLVQKLSEEIRTLVHTICPARYKLVCVVALGQKIGNGAVMVASRCLWDVNSDTCVSYTHHSSKLYCTVSLYAVYYE